MKPLAALACANREFETRLRAVGPADWTAPTPCDEWDVRALVNHVVGANSRYLMLLAGAAASEVDATRTADHLGEDPVGSFSTSAADLMAAFDTADAMTRVTHHPTGDRTGAELVKMRVLDVAVHAWDLARAVGLDEVLDPDLVAFLLDDNSALNPQLELLVRTGRNPGTIKEPR